MREIAEIISVFENERKVIINREKFYDNLKLSELYNSCNRTSEEMFIYAKAMEFFRNAIVGILEHLHKGYEVYLDCQLLCSTMQEFKGWINSKINSELKMNIQYIFIDSAYNTIEG